MQLNSMGTHTCSSSWSAVVSGSLACRRTACLSSSVWWLAITCTHAQFARQAPPVLATLCDASSEAHARHHAKLCAQQGHLCCTACVRVQPKVPSSVPLQGLVLLMHEVIPVLCPTSTPQASHKQDHDSLLACMKARLPENPRKLPLQARVPHRQVAALNSRSLSVTQA